MGCTRGSDMHRTPAAKGTDDLRKGAPCCRFRVLFINWGGDLWQRLPERWGNGSETCFCKPLKKRRRRSRTGEEVRGWGQLQSNPAKGCTYPVTHCMQGFRVDMHQACMMPISPWWPCTWGCRCIAEGLPRHLARVDVVRLPAQHIPDMCPYDLALLILQARHASCRGCCADNRQIEPLHALHWKVTQPHMKGRQFLYVCRPYIRKGRHDGHDPCIRSP